MQDYLLEHIENLAKAIFLNKSDAPGASGYLSRVQKKGIKGVHILEYDSYDLDGPHVKGNISNRWLYDSKGFRNCDSLPESIPYDGISSPFPVLRFSNADEEVVVINCTFGPRAGRGFTCKLTEIYGYKTFELLEGEAWAS